MNFKGWASKLEIIKIGKPNIAIVGGVHGDELGSCLGIVDFIHQKSPQNIVAIPCANAWGLKHGKRNNEDDVDINRHFDGNDIRETTAIKKAIADVKFCITVHENTNSGGFFLYYSDKKLIPLAKSVVEIAKGFFPIKDGKLKDRKIKKCLNAAEGLVYCPDTDSGTLEDEMAKRDIPCICLELPKEHRLQTRRKAVVAILSEMIYNV